MNAFPRVTWDRFSCLFPMKNRIKDNGGASKNKLRVQSGKTGAEERF